MPVNAKVPFRSGLCAPDFSLFLSLYIIELLWQTYQFFFYKTLTDKGANVALPESLTEQMWHFDMCDDNLSGSSGLSAFPCSGGHQKQDKVSWDSGIQAQVSGKHCSRTS